MVRNGEPSAKKRKSVKVCPSEERAIFSTMEYMESAPDSDGPVKSWIANQSEGKVGDFVDNKMVLGDVVTEVLSAATGGVLATVHCATESTAIASSRSAAQSWGKSGNGFQRSKMLYSITREVQKQSKLLALTESISTGIHIRESKEAVTSLVQSLYHYTGVTQTGTPLGVVDTSSLTVDGVFGVGEVPDITSPVVRVSAAPGRSSMVVFAVSDVDSAAQTCLDKAFAGYGKTSASIGRVLVQQPVYDRFCKILRERAPRLMVGSPLDGCVDVGCSVQDTVDVLEGMIGENGHLEKVVVSVRCFRKELLLVSY
eukprot:sb/3467041/